MDLLDDSGDEGNPGGRAEAEVDENILLNSDDEEGGVTKHSYVFQNSINEEELLYEGDEEEEEYVEDTEDVLDLELGDEELETPDPLLESDEIAPVKFRAQFHHESHEESYHVSSEVDEGHMSHHTIETLHSGGVGGGDRHLADSPPPEEHEPMTQSQSACAVDSDDDDEPRHRSRFLTERKTDDISKHSISSEGKPITTLGERNPRLGQGHSLDSRRGRGGGGGGFSNMRGHGPRHLGPRGMGMMGGNLNQRQQRPPSLLGDRPRPGLLRFPNYNQLNILRNQRGHPIHQLPGGFIDFNHPIRQPAKSPIRNIAPQNVPQSPQKPQGQGLVPPSQNNMNASNIQSQKVQGKPALGGPNVNIVNKPIQVATSAVPKIANNISPKRPALGPRQPLVRQMRPRIPPQNQNQFMGPPNQGPGPVPRGGGPRHRHPQPQPHFRPGGPQQQQQQQQQWHPNNPNNPPQQTPQPHQQHLGPRGPIVVIGPGPGNQQIINRRLEPPEQFSNFGGPVGLMGPHPSQQQQPGPPFHDGFQNIRQPFPPQPRFSSPEEMMHHNGGLIPGPPGPPIPGMQHQQLPHGPHHPFMPPQQQNFPPPQQELLPYPQHQHPPNPFFPPMRPGGDMQRARSPQIGYGQGPPQQQQPVRFPPPGQDQPQQQQHGPPMHHSGVGEMGLHPHNQGQPPFQPQQKVTNRLNPFRSVPSEHPQSHQQHSFHPEQGRPGQFFQEVGRTVSIEPNPSTSAEYSDPHASYYQDSGHGSLDEPRYRERERDSYDHDHDRGSYDRERERDSHYDHERDSYSRERERERERDRDRNRDRYYDYEASSSSSREYHRERRDRDDDFYEDSRSSQSSRLPAKRVGDFRDEYSSAPDRKKYASPEKRLDGRLGPPVAKQTERFEDSAKQDEVIKIIKESQKVMGLDADYLRKIEEQKAMRAQILQEKEHRRKKQQQSSSGQSQGQGQSSSQSSSADENSRREVRILATGAGGSGAGGGGGGQPRPQQQSMKPKVSAGMQRAAVGRQEIRVENNQNQSQTSSDVSSSSSKSIYVNPRAFHGDLSVLNSNLKMINMNVRSVGGGRVGDAAGPGQGRNANNGAHTIHPSNGSAPPVRQVVGGAGNGGASAAMSGTSTATSTGTGVAKKRTILRIVRNKKGEIISKSKVIVLPKGSLLRGSAATQ